MILSAAVALFRQHLLAKRRSPRTLEWYDAQLAVLSSWLAQAGYGDVIPDADVIDEYLAAQNAAGLKPATVRARFGALRALLLFLERRRRIRHDDNPIHLVDPPSVPQVVRRYVTERDFDRLLATLAESWIDDRDRLILFLLYYSGLRLAELCSLQVESVDLDALLVMVRQGKGNKDRVVPVHPQLRALLPRYLFTRPEHRDQLWLSSDGYGGAAGVLTREGVRQMLERRCIRAGIEPPYGPHAFRHAFAMWTLNAGVRLESVSWMMGHSDTQITRRTYAHTQAQAAQREYEAGLKAAGEP